MRRIIISGLVTAILVAGVQPTSVEASELARTRSTSTGVPTALAQGAPFSFHNSFTANLCGHKASCHNNGGDEAWMQLAVLVQMSLQQGILPVYIAVQEACLSQIANFHAWLRTYINAYYVGAMYASQTAQEELPSCQSSQYTAGYSQYMYGNAVFVLNTSIAVGGSPTFNDTYKLWQFPNQTPQSGSPELRGAVCVVGFVFGAYQGCTAHLTSVKSNPVQTSDVIALQAYYYVRAYVEPCVFGYSSCWKGASGGWRILWGGDLNLNPGEFTTSVNQYGHPAFAYSTHREADRCVDPPNRWTINKSGGVPLDYDQKIDYHFDSGPGYPANRCVSGIDALLFPYAYADLQDNDATDEVSPSDHRVLAGRWS